MFGPKTDRMMTGNEIARSAVVFELAGVSVRLPWQPHRFGG